MITAVRYIPSSDNAPLFSAMLSGAPLSHSFRVFYDLSGGEVRARLEQALRSGEEGVAASDLAAVEAGGLREEVLKRLFTAEALERAFVGTEEVIVRRAV